MSTDNSSTATTTDPFVTDFAGGSNIHPWLYSFIGRPSTVYDAPRCFFNIADCLRKAAINTIRDETGHSGQRTVAELEHLRFKSSDDSEMYKIYDKLLAVFGNHSLIETGSQSKLLNLYVASRAMADRCSIAALDPDKQIRQYHRNTGEYIEVTSLPNGASGIQRIERLGFTETKQTDIVFDFSDL